MAVAGDGGADANDEENDLEKQGESHSCFDGSLSLDVFFLSCSLLFLSARSLTSTSVDDSHDCLSNRGLSLDGCVIVAKRSDSEWGKVC